jgi:2-dehydro-3-deoxyphosphogluconate aldolase / (4S)-4-hydroxy-2-oxoglutarate aldolase
MAHHPGVSVVTINKNSVIDQLQRLGVVAVVRCPSAERLTDVVTALHDGGIRAIEITMTTPGAIELIGDLVARFDPLDVLVGAGTVVDLSQAAAVIDAGAQYVFSPTINLDVIAYCNQRQVVVIPGALTPTEIHTAWRAGADVVKVFPANIAGPNYFRDLAGPLPGIRLMATGGVDFETAPHYFAAGAFAVGVGGAVIGGSLIREGRFAAIRANAERFVSLIEEARRQ